MIEKYLHTLEYPKVLNQLAEHTMFSASKTLALDLKPSPHYREALTLQAETREARHLLTIRPGLGIGGARDVRPFIDQASRSIIVSPHDLLDIRQTLISARELRRSVTKLEDQFPLLADIAYRLEECPGVINQITQCIADSGEIKNDATPNLARIRREIDVTHGRLLDKLRRLVASERYSQYLQEGFITQRDGRYVIPLKSDFKGRIKGVVHDQSSSGATLFVEPLPVVEMNNALRRLEAEEEEEIRRILLAIAQRVAAEGKQIGATVQALAELDLLFAKARYAEHIRAIPPDLFDWPGPGEDHRSRIILRRARHPLLNPETVVPIDLIFEPDVSMLIITGPNTGGKTVSLKTVGLLALMAQSGLQIPADDRSGLMVFDGIYADIGDEQSLEQSLSTFSSHMTNIVNILQHGTQDSLLIFDELGAGTDPIEGAALARSILGKLLAGKITTLVATHYAELKAYAYITPGVANASMEFNLETLSPTYRLRMGLPGNSNAFAIAGRLGLDQTIIQGATGLVNDDSKETEKMLLQIRTELEEARMERLRLGEERAEAEYYRGKVEEEWTKIEAEKLAVLNEARAKARDEVEATRRELDRLKQQASAAIAAAQITQRRTQVNTEIKETETTLDRLAERLTPAMPVEPKAAPQAKKRSLKVGDKVEVPHLRAKGVVTNINKNDIEVQLGHFRTSLKRREIVPTEPEEAEPVVASRGNGGGIPESPGLELDLRGRVSEDALLELEGYLDQAYLAGLPFVRIIHGKGSGVLRQVVREALNSHPLISSYKAGADSEGGEGVTVARLALD